MTPERFVHYRLDDDADARNLEILRIIETISRAIKTGEIVYAKELADQLCALIKQHLEHEEQLMSSTGFPFIDWHIDKHRFFMSKTKAFQKSICSISSQVWNGYQVAQIISDFQEMFIQHIDVLDRQFFNFLKAQK
jgi:hemerythrin-like metal-binding protein